MRASLKFSSRTYLLTGITVLAVAALVFFWLRGDAPIAIVNGAPIATRRLSLDTEAAAAYYANAKKIYPVPDAKELDRKNLEAEVLTRLIEAELIEDGLNKEAGKDAQHLLNTKLARYENNTELSKAATALYGMDYRDFWNEVIVPQAKRDILSGRLFLRGEVMDEWLTRAKREAKVILFSDGFRWNGAYVEAVK